MYKGLVFLALAAAVSAHDVVVGTNSTGKKIFDQNKTASPAIWRRADNITIIANDTEVISGVVITDLRPEKDGDAKVVDGGQGKKNVTVELKSPAVFRGYDFHIEVYTAPDENDHSDDISLNKGASEDNIPISIGNDTRVNNDETPTSDVYPTTMEGLEYIDNPEVKEITTAAVKETKDDADVEIKANNDKINLPVLTGKDENRPNRDTENQGINNSKMDVSTQKVQHVPVPYPIAALNFNKNTQTTTADEHIKPQEDTLKKDHSITPQVNLNTPNVPQTTDIKSTTDISTNNVTEKKELNNAGTMVQNDKDQLNTTAVVPPSTESQPKIISKQ